MWDFCDLYPDQIPGLGETGKLEEKPPTIKSVSSGSSMGQGDPELPRSLACHCNNKMSPSGLRPCTVETSKSDAILLLVKSQEVELGRALWKLP